MGVINSESSSIKTSKTTVIEKFHTGYLLFLFLFFVQNLVAQSAGSGNNLTFDGSDDYVDCGTSINLNGSSFTIELWAKRASTAAADIHFVSLGSPANNQGLHIRWQSNNTLRFGFWNNDYDIAGLTIDLNWHHFAFVYNAVSNTKSVYMDGKNVGNNSSNPNDFVGSGRFKIGSLVDGYGNGNVAPWYGSIDEVRVWNTDLTQTQIRDWMCKKVTSAHSNWGNLLAYYNCDAGTGTSLADGKGSNTGTLTNGTTWNISGAPIGNASYWLTAVSSGSSVNIAHANGDDLTATMTAGTADLMMIYRVDHAPDNNTPPSSFNQLSQVDYYGVKLFGSSGGTYTVTYNYDGHPGISNEANLKLASRPDNSYSWSGTSANLDQVAKTLTLTGQTGTEFILGSSLSNTLPIGLLNFEASSPDNKRAIIKWETESEKNNDFFTLQKSTNAIDWETLAVIDGAGNSSDLLHYSFIDSNPFHPIAYYRLKQTDFDGKYMYSDVICLVTNEKTEKTILIYPNPASEFIIVDKLPAECVLKIVDMLGHPVYQMVPDDKTCKIALDQFVNGVYFLVEENGNNKTIEKFSVKK